MNLLIDKPLEKIIKGLFFTSLILFPHNKFTNNYSESRTNLLPKIYFDFKFYSKQIENNYEKIFPIIEKYSYLTKDQSTTKTHSNDLFKKYVISLITQESNFIHTKPDGSLIRSWADAIGISQFTKEGVKALNNYLAKKRKENSNYNKIKDANIDILKKNDDEGVVEGLRDAVLLSSIQLERHKGRWRFSAIEYNWGRSLKGDYERIEDKLPDETKNYVKRIEKHMNCFEKRGYERYLKQRWGIVLMELENLYGNKSLQKKDFFKAEQHYSNVIILNYLLKIEGLDTNMRYKDKVLLHSHYQLGEIAYFENDYVNALKEFNLVLKTNSEERYEYKNSSFYRTIILSKNEYDKRVISKRPVDVELNAISQLNKTKQ